MVRYREIHPSARLRPFINTFWILEHDGEDSAPQRVVPDGRSELILNWSQPFESFQSGPWRGQSRSFFAGQINGPMHELSGRFTPVEDLSPVLARNLNHALESPDPIAAVEAALLAASRGDDVLVAEAVRRITVAKGASDLAALAREIGLSIRQLERRFHAAVGLTPKLFCRIQRFNNVFQVLRGPSRNWVETAVACGYYDQAHLIRDCKSLSGSTPSILMAADADLARHFYLSHSYNTAESGSV